MKSGWGRPSKLQQKFLSNLLLEGGHVFCRLVYSNGGDGIVLTFHRGDEMPASCSTTMRLAAALMLLPEDQTLIFADPWGAG